VAAELVETTKLYARTVAGVHPLWVEKAAAHLVKRELTDPHWRPDIGRVLAYEKVTLQGLTLVPRRKVHFGPLEPRLSREIFIHHALVLGEYETDAPFFAHNRKLIRDVETLEAKSRRRDVLVEPKARFAFYDARIPERVYTAQEFERLVLFTHRLSMEVYARIQSPVKPHRLSMDGRPCRETRIGYVR